MPSLTLKPPRLQPDSDLVDEHTIRPPIQPHQRAESPVAPAFSPITPKLQPKLPVKAQPPFVPPENATDFTFSVGSMPPQQEEGPVSDQPVTPAPQCIPRPPTQPFSSEDASDAIALRAAISTLQFQKKKAQEDIKRLRGIKQLALDDPDHFKTELAAGKLKEQKPTIGNLQSILDAESGSDDDESVVFGAQEEDKNERVASSFDDREIPDSQPSRPSSQDRPPSLSDRMDVDKRPEFPRIPGPQTVVRMPHVNWDKYGIVGEPLDSLHEQQRRWPGSAPFQRDRGREFTVAAPYSPFLDNLDAQHYSSDPSEIRKDSAATVSEHPMETRSRG